MHGRHFTWIAAQHPAWPGFRDCGSGIRYSRFAISRGPEWDLKAGHSKWRAESQHYRSGTQRGRKHSRNARELRALDYSNYEIILSTTAPLTGLAGSWTSSPQFPGPTVCEGTSFLTWPSGLVRETHAMVDGQPAGDGDWPVYSPMPIALQN